MQPHSLLQQIFSMAPFVSRKLWYPSNFYGCKSFSTTLLSSTIRPIFLIGATILTWGNPTTHAATFLALQVQPLLVLILRFECYRALSHNCRMCHCMPLKYWQTLFLWTWSFVVLLFQDSILETWKSSGSCTLKWWGFRYDTVLMWLDSVIIL